MITCDFLTTYSWFFLCFPLLLFHRISITLSPSPFYFYRALDSLMDKEIANVGLACPATWPWAFFLGMSVACWGGHSRGWAECIGRAWRENKGHLAAGCGDNRWHLTEKTIGPEVGMGQGWWDHGWGRVGSLLPGLTCRSRTVSHLPTIPLWLRSASLYWLIAEAQ